MGDEEEEEEELEQQQVVLTQQVRVREGGACRPSVMSGDAVATTRANAYAQTSTRPARSEADARR